MEDWLDPLFQMAHWGAIRASLVADDSLPERGGPRDGDDYFEFSFLGGWSFLKHPAVPHFTRVPGYRVPTRRFARADVIEEHPSPKSQAYTPRNPRTWMDIGLQLLVAVN